MGAVAVDNILHAIYINESVPAAYLNYNGQLTEIGLSNNVLLPLINVLSRFVWMYIQ
jgi:hypothetical protein